MSTVEMPNMAGPMPVSTAAALSPLSKKTRRSAVIQLCHAWLGEYIVCAVE
jgi:hypothetical protein